MDLFYTDFDRRFLDELRAEQADPQPFVDVDTLRRKARLYDILIGATTREFEAIMDAVNATGCNPEPLVEALGRKQGAV
jgi:hypothetical protein